MISFSVKSLVCTVFIRLAMTINIITQATTGQGSIAEHRFKHADIWSKSKKATCRDRGNTHESTLKQRATKHIQLCAPYFKPSEEENYTSTLINCIWIHKNASYAIIIYQIISFANIIKCSPFWIFFFLQLTEMFLLFKPAGLIMYKKPKSLLLSTPCILSWRALLN